MEKRWSREPHVRTMESALLLVVPLVGEAINQDLIAWDVHLVLRSAQPPRHTYVVSVVAEQPPGKQKQNNTNSYSTRRCFEHTRGYLLLNYGTPGISLVNCLGYTEPLAVCNVLASSCHAGKLNCRRKPVIEALAPRPMNYSKL